MTSNNYFKFTASHRYDESSPRLVRFEFFNDRDTKAAEKAFDRAMRNLSKTSGVVSVWSALDYSGRWDDYKVREVGR